MSKKLPDDFDPEEYLDIYPDLRKAGVDPAQHYLDHALAEHRVYKRTSPLLPKLYRPYEHDGLYSVHNHDFMADPQYQAAYQRGVQATGADYQWYWRVHMGLWAARSAARVEGDFVECGVNLGFLSSAIMKLLDWDTTGRTFFLLDTFSGLDARFVADTERDGGAIEWNAMALESGLYTNSLAKVEQNFSEWRNKRFVVGSIPETLPQVTAQKVAFMHIDMNCSPPEVAAIDCLWPRIQTGGIVLLDDYGYHGFQPQKEGMDAWARQNGVPIASLPTGQGLMVKA
jgi:hypothetical protein